MKDLTDPTNRDTVPAMLTPGEFVLNKEASTMYAPMIEQMNNNGLALRAERNMGGAVPMYNEGGEVDPFDQYFETLLQHEGGWSDHSADRGGKTNLGITLNTLKSIKPGATEADLRNLTKDQAKQIYKKNYYDAAGISKLPENIRGQAFDIAVNSGPGRAAKMVQELAGVEQDGAIGPETLKALEGSGVNNNMLADRRQQFYDGIIANDPSQAAFQNGWTNRANSFRDGVDSSPVPPSNPGLGSSLRPQVRPMSEQAVPESPRPQARPDEGGMPQDAIMSALQMALGGGGGQQVSAPPVASTAGGVEYIPSVTERDPNRNMGGPVGLNVGGWLSGLFGGNNDEEQVPAQDPFAGYANYSQQDFLNEAEMINNPGAQTQGYQTVPGMSAPGVQPGVGLSPSGEEASPFGQMPVQPMGEYVNPDQTPIPPPNSDEALLQGGSQSVQQALDEELGVPELGRGSVMDPTAAYNSDGFEDHLIERDMQATRDANVAEDQRIADANAATARGVNAYGGMSSMEVPSVEEEVPMTQEQLMSNSLDDYYRGMANQEIDYLKEQQVNATDPEEILALEEQIEAGQATLDQTEANMQAASADAERRASMSDTQLQIQEAADAGGVSYEEVAANHIADADAKIEKAKGILQANPDMSDNARAAITRSIEIQEGRKVEAAGPTGEETPVKEEPQSEEQIAAAMAGTGDVVEQLNQEVVNSGENPEVTPDEQSAIKGAESQATPAQVNEGKKAIQEAFGDLFDKKELGRAALMFAGAMITGMSPGRALAFAGQGYMQRLDAKEKHGQTMQANALKAQRETDDANKQVFDYTKTKKVVGPDGKTLDLVEVEQGDMTYWADPKTKMPVVIGSDGYHDDLSRDRNSEQYADKVNASRAVLEPIVTESLIKTGKDDFGNVTYDKGLKPQAVTTAIADFAASEGLDPAMLGTVTQRAIANALASNDKKVNDIRGYINEAYIEANVPGGRELLGPASAGEVNGLMQRFQSRFADVEGFKGRSQIEVSTLVMQKARPHWNALPQAEKDRLNGSAATGQTGFTRWLKEQLDEKQLKEQIK